MIFKHRLDLSLENMSQTDMEAFKCSLCQHCIKTGNVNGPRKGIVNVTVHVTVAKLINLVKFYTLVVFT